MTPFVTKRIRQPRGEFRQVEEFEGDNKGPLSGRRYLSRWKSENGTE